MKTPEGQPVSMVGMIAVRRRSMVMKAVGARVRIRWLQARVNGVLSVKVRSV